MARPRSLGYDDHRGQILAAVTVGDQAGNFAVGQSLFWGDGSSLTTDHSAISLGSSSNPTNRPYLDFHLHGATDGYNARLINDEDGVLSFRAKDNIAQIQFSADAGGSIELGKTSLAGTRPFIDFHKGKGAGDEDFNARIINEADGALDFYGVTDPRFKFHGKVICEVLQITGGADLAEHLSVTDAHPQDEFKVEAGMVVSIDPSGNRKFKLSDEPYDRKRVGIISGGHGVQPGLILRDEGNPAADGEQPIALTGQVWCHADASPGAITPGDLLTTSSTPGHAMKASDDTKARFAVLGQALTGLKEGRGWVQVLVGKQ